MASARMTVTLDRALADRARRLGIDTPAAARAGVEAAVRAAMVWVDRAAYQRQPERPDPFWSAVEAWTEDWLGPR